MVNLAEVTRDVTTRLGPELARSGSSLSVSSQGEPVGMWDRTRLDQVVTNIVSNAIKYGLGRPVEILTRCDDDHAVLTVRDHGIGVARELRQHIFDPFARPASARNYGGLRLRLYP